MPGAGGVTPAAASDGASDVPELVPVPVEPPVLPTPLQVREVAWSDVLALSLPPRIVVPSALLPSGVTAALVPGAAVAVVPGALPRPGPDERVAPWLDGCTGLSVDEASVPWAMAQAEDRASTPAAAR
ncbi:hypothetical protein NCCP691_03890 [Noviherbaspirillum aridicola]|uniref:Uncharacterized protein n=1 Tax=Noviherbaspirillum aridicola TaxID=2849687 RepID=A0ABQ4PZW7_9BURK|nr:hypothetical protein NCCP691_03890 [Noviherbaspirillum aridicola]